MERNIYKIGKELFITSNEEIKEGNYYITPNNTILKALGSMVINVEDYKKIILTTDQDLIKDGVQAINDEFLEWFVNNPSCEKVEVTYDVLKPFKSENKGYLIHCPDNEVLEEPKQETTLKELLLQLRNTPMTFVPKKEQKQHLIDMMRGDEELGLYEEPKQETLEEVAKSEAFEFKVDYKPFETDLDYREYAEFGFKKGFNAGAEWQAERSYSEKEVLAMLIIKHDALTAEYVLEIFKKR